MTVPGVQQTAGNDLPVGTPEVGLRLHLAKQQSDALPYRTLDPVDRRPDLPGIQGVQNAVTGVRRLRLQAVLDCGFPVEQASPPAVFLVPASPVDHRLDRSTRPPKGVKSVSMRSPSSNEVSAQAATSVSS